MVSPANLFGTIHEDLVFQLTIPDVDPSLLRVASFRALEELSVLFQYTIVVGTDPDHVSKLEETLGRDATFVIERDGKPVRRVHGIISDVCPDGAFVGKNQARVVFTLEPRMANLRYSGGFRIFQEKAAHEIISELCQPEQIECLWYVRGVPQKRTYCTQLHESDYDFIVRLASEEGMHFLFKHDEQKTSLVFVSEPKGYEEIEPDLSISFNETQGAVSEEHVRSIQRARRIRTGAFEHRDYNFIEPGKELVARAQTPGTETPGNSHKREWRDYPGRFIDKEGPGKSLAQQRLDELRSDASVVVGTAYSARLVAGGTFMLTGHRDDGFNRSLLLTRIELEGHVQGALHDSGGFRGSLGLTSFVAVPAEISVHPARVPKPPSRIQSARVVGPKDGDPYVDEYGRIKVQFFWDRDGTFNENSSCWMRMATPVAHADEGFWQAHKVGAEVLVGFIDDDIDRPVVLSAVYNPVQPQPNPLPAQVAKSTWKTKSIPGNVGFNEITQDNTAGKEVLFMHAQKDRSTVVLANHMEKVGANQSSTMGANQTVTVGANQTISVGAARTVTVGAAHSVTVTADETNTVHGKRTETVDTGEEVTIKSGRTHTVESGDDKVEVKAGARNEVFNLTRDVKVTLADSLQALSKSEDVKTTYVSKAGAMMHVKRGDDEQLLLMPGSAKLSTTFASISLAGSKIVLQVGGSSISLSADGTIELKASSKIVSTVGGSSVTVDPSKSALAGASVEVNAVSQAKIQGAVVKIN